MIKLAHAGDIIETVITRLGIEGDGVGTYHGYHVIVPKTAIGDKVSCKVKYITKDRIHADLLCIIEPSQRRIKPPCEYYELCGGCGLQHITKEEYKNYKLGQLTVALEKNNIPLPSSIPWFSVGEVSRRRAFVRFDKSGSLGFYEHQSHKVIDINKCLILDAEIEVLLRPLKELSVKLPVNIEGWMLTKTDCGIDIALHSDNKKIKNESIIFSSLATFAKQYGLARVLWKRDGKSTQVTTLRKPMLFIGGREIILPEEYFLQASKAGQDAILEAVVPHVSEGDMVLDLFSGVGIYSFAVADKVKKVSAYEIAPEMVEAMENNIRSNKLSDKITAYCRDIETFPLGRDELAKFDTAIINPPRSGALKQVNVLAAGQVKKIIMVSCNSASFARDAKILYDNGYTLSFLSAIDQFYYSHHLEQVGVFKKY